MKHNEHEVNDFKTNMATIGVDDAVVIDPCVRTLEQAKEMLPSDKRHWLYDPEALRHGELKTKTAPDNLCPWIYYSMAILVNGDVVPCCRDPKGELVMGNLLSQSLDEVWNGDCYRSLRVKLQQNQKQIDMCTLCSGYGVSAIK